MQVKIVDADGLTVPRGEKGELYTRGYSVMLGYWNRPEENAKALIEGGAPDDDKALRIARTKTDFQRPAQSIATARVRPASVQVRA